MIEQRTEEWFQQRLGKVTASRISDVIAKTKTGVSTSRQNYLIQLVSERLTGKKGDSFVNQAMLDGIEREGAARELYERTRGVSVTEVGFFDTLMSKSVPSKYIPQMQWQLACTGAKWVDFVSYNPNFPEELQLFVARVDRDDTYIAELEAEVVKFLDEVEQTILKLKE